VSFFGFMLLGPAVLIALRVYLQMYVEHGDRLDRLARSVSAERAPTLVPLQNPLIRLLSALTFYALLPVAILLFAWKAAVFRAWGSGLRGLGVVSGGLLAVAAGVVASHVMLPLKTFSWRSKALLSTGAVIVVAGMMAGFMRAGFEPVRRPFDLFRANLSGQWLVQSDLRGANLFGANLRGARLNGANLFEADLRGADLFNANLQVANLRGATLYSVKLNGADLNGADLSGANLNSDDLSGANLSAADLSGANLSGANLSGANLSGARNLSQRQLDEACGNATTKLPEGLTLKPCSKD
jgi:hypothetical protein